MRLILLFFSCSLFAAYPVSIQSIVCREVESSSRYFTLSDYSWWKVVRFEPRWRTPVEWWQGVELIPKEYDSHPKNWHPHHEIEVYSKADFYRNSVITEENASNQEALKACTHVLLNRHTQEVLFAIYLDPSMALREVFQGAKEAGKQEGYRQGYSEGAQTRHFTEASKEQAAYQRGFHDGKEQGEREGFRRGYEEGGSRRRGFE